MRLNSRLNKSAIIDKKQKERRLRLIDQIRKNLISNPVKDIIAGIIVALVSLPIGLGYAQIAGLPAVYGLYGSFLPIMVFGLMTTSPQFAIGVDAMPAAMVGGLLAELMIAPESETAMNLVPLISFLVAIWMLIFYFLNAGRIVKYISSPVLSGFISGVGATIILMQIPKLFGGSAGTGELLVLIENTVSQLDKVNYLSLALGLGTIIIIQICKKFIPKVPMTVAMMAVGALLQAIFHLDNYGVKLLPEVEAGLPHIVIPNLAVMNGHVIDVLVESVSIAGVIMAQTLLATGSYAAKGGYEIDSKKELLAYAGMNVAGGLVGSCPINGSVSRSAIAVNNGTKSQIMSLTAGLVMLLVLLFGTPVLKYLPVPVLTAIVMTALIGILDFKMMKRLWNECKGEWVVFMLSFAAVLVLGTVKGVVVGCMLSFWEVAVRSVQPPSCFVGRIPGHGNFHSMARNSHAHPIKNTVIYRFSGNLFFANIDKFEGDILGAIKDDTRVVVVDARGIGNIDITAIDRLVALVKKLEARDISFYITEHESALNDQIRQLGGESLLDKGIVRRTITLALRDAGIDKPYQLEGVEPDEVGEYLESEEKLAEFEWAFGDKAEEKMQQLAEATAEELRESITAHDEHISILESHGAITKWGMLGLFDEHEFWDHLEARLEKLSEEEKLSKEDVAWIEERIEKRRHLGEVRLSELNPEALKVLSKHRKRIIEHLKKRR